MEVNSQTIFGAYLGGFGVTKDSRLLQRPQRARRTFGIGLDQ